MKTLTILLFLPFLTAHAGGKTDSLGEVHVTATPKANADAVADLDADISGAVTGQFDNAGNLSSILRNTTQIFDMGSLAYGDTLTRCHERNGTKQGANLFRVGGKVSINEVCIKGQHQIEQTIADAQKALAEADLARAQAERDRAAIQRMEAERRGYEGDRK